MKTNEKILLVLSTCLLISFLGATFFIKGFLRKGQTIKQLPSNYQECKSAGFSANDLVCDFTISGPGSIFEGCDLNGGAVSHHDFSGDYFCSISYYNFSFNKWPQNYQECIKVFGDGSGSGLCAEIIPRTHTYQPEFSQVLKIINNCLANGGENLGYGGKIGGNLLKQSCYIGFKK